jgi:uncharacterized membrane protein (UPF0127 family)
MEYATTFFKKSIGLMFRVAAPKDGFLFTFEREGFHSIWMPFMKFPIDIVFYDKDGKFINIARGAKPISMNPETWKIYKPEKPCKYILEMGCNVKYREKIVKIV